MNTQTYAPDATLIAAQNDRFRRLVCSVAPGLGTARTECDGLPGRVVFTQAVAALGPLFPLLALLAVTPSTTRSRPRTIPTGGTISGRSRSMAGRSGSRSTSTATRASNGAPSGRTIRRGRCAS